MHIIAFLPVIIIGVLAVIAIAGLSIISINLKEVVKTGGAPIANTFPILALVLLVAIGIYGFKTFKAG